MYRRVRSARGRDPGVGRTLLRGGAEFSTRAERTTPGRGVLEWAGHWRGTCFRGGLSRSPRPWGPHPLTPVNSRASLQ